MAGVRVITGPPIDTPIKELNDPLTARIHFGMRLADGIRRLHEDCRPIAQLIGEAEEAGWPALGYESRDDFLKREMKLHPRTVDLALEGLRYFDLHDRVPIDKAVDAAERMRKAEPIREHGGDRCSASAKEQVDNVNLVSTQGGNSAAYLAARIKRDRPDIAEAVERGEYPSIRAAAIAAGIVKPPCPVQDAKRAVRKMSPEQKAAFEQWMAAARREA